jgi:hypothetical protein
MHIQVLTYLDSVITDFTYGRKDAKITGKRYQADRPPPPANKFDLSPGDLWTCGSKTYFWMGRMWSRYNPDVTNVKEMQRHPSDDKLILSNTTNGTLTWMPPGSKRSVVSRKKKEHVSGDNEVSTCFHERSLVQN